MANLPEVAAWESGILQLEEADRAQAGSGGVLNIPPTQLANRTQWLREQIESASDYREYTFYVTESDPDGTIEGLINTPAGKMFRVAQSSTDTLAFIYYLNNSGVAIAITSLLGRGAIANNIRFFASHLLAQTDLSAGNILDGYKCWVANDSDSTLYEEYINNSGILEPTGREMPSQAAVNLLANSIANLLMGLQLNSIAINDVGSWLSTELGAIQDEISKSGSETSRTLMNLFLGLQGVESAVAEVYSYAESKPDSSALTDFEFFRLYWLQVFGTQLAALEGLSTDTIATKDDLAELASQITGVALEPVTDGIYVVGEPRGIIRIDLTSAGSIPSSKDEGSVAGYISVKIDGQSFGANCEFSVQGASSALYAKKNLSFDLFSDDALEEEVKLAIGNVLPHETWVYKANWIDTTHIRNTMSYNLWEQVVQSRTTWPKREVESVFVGKFGVNGTLNGANGHPVGYPCVVFFNWEFYGIGDFMTGKKRTNYNLAKNSPLQIQLDIGGWLTFGDFSSHITDANYIELKAPKSPTSATYDAITAWDAFCNLAQAEFTAALPARLDKVNIIDYFLFTTFGNFTDCGAVNTIKNTQLVSYDGVRWYFMPYDLDTCYGLQWDGASINYPPTNPIRLNGDFWTKVRAVYDDDINTRWAELRDSGIFSVSNVYTLILNLQGKYSQDLFSAEFARWPTVPSLGITGIDQVLTWIKNRIAFLDTQFSYTA
ncbi:CotH kinase family protein [Klebsiella quasipneumoniae]